MVLNTLTRVVVQFFYIHTKTIFIVGSKLIARRPSDCDDIKTRRSGVYKIYPKGSAEGFEVYCDMKTDGGRWTVSITQK